MNNDNLQSPGRRVPIERVEYVDYHALIASSQFAVVMFFASWDSGSRLLLSQLKRVAMTGQCRVALGWIDIEISKESYDLAGELQLYNTPALAFFRDGAQVALLYGGHHTISDQIEQLVSGKEITPSPEPVFPGPKSQVAPAWHVADPGVTPGLWKRFRLWLLGARKPH